MLSKFGGKIFQYSKVNSAILDVLGRMENSILVSENLQTQKIVFQQNRLIAAIRSAAAFSHQGRTVTDKDGP